MCDPGWEGTHCLCADTFCVHGTCVDGVCVECDDGYRMVGNGTCELVSTECMITSGSLQRICLPANSTTVTFVATSLGTLPVANATFNVSVVPADGTTSISFAGGGQTGVTNSSGAGSFVIAASRPGSYLIVISILTTNVTCGNTITVTNQSSSTCSVVSGAKQIFVETQHSEPLANEVVLIFQNECGVASPNATFFSESDTSGLVTHDHAPTNSTGYGSIGVNGFNPFVDGTFRVFDEAGHTICRVLNQTSVVDLCINATCATNATCTQGGPTLTNVTCSCNEGFVGNGTSCGFCPQCMFGGVCVPDTTMMDSAICQCPANTVGPVCETLLVCDPDLCGADGKCIANDPTGAFSCNCTEGFAGTFCEFTTPVCAVNATCGPYGYCQSGTCQCIGQMRDTFCQTNSTLLLSNCTDESRNGLVCSGHGVCSTVLTSNFPTLFQCQCYNGTVGVRCELNACDVGNGGCDVHRPCSYDRFHNVVCGPCTSGYYLNTTLARCERMQCEIEPPAVSMFPSVGSGRDDSVANVIVTSNVTGNGLPGVEVTWFLLGTNFTDVALTTDQVVHTNPLGLAPIVISVFANDVVPVRNYVLISLIANSTVLNCTIPVQIEITP